MALDHVSALAPDAEVGVHPRHETLPRLLGDVLVQVPGVYPQHRHRHRVVTLSEISKIFVTGPLLQFTNFYDDPEADNKAHYSTVHMIQKSDMQSIDSKLWFINFSQNTTPVSSSVTDIGYHYKIYTKVAVVVVVRKR